MTTKADLMAEIECPECGGPRKRSWLIDTCCVSYGRQDILICLECGAREWVPTTKGINQRPKCKHRDIYTIKGINR